jgi:cytochrome c553
MRWIWIVIVALLLVGCEKKEEKNERVAEPAGQIKITENVVKEEKAKAKELDKGEFYYSYKEAKKQEEQVQDEAKYTKLGAYRHIKNYEAVQISLLANKLSKDFLIYCSACHDDYANGVIGPSLLGKSGDYIYKQLQEFKSGKRKNVLMVQLVRRLSDEKLKKLADEIAEFNEKVQKIKEQNKLKG